MANFVLTAQIALQAPRNVNQVVSQIRRQLQGISVNIKVNANTQALNNTNAQLATTTKSARAAEKSISDLGRSLGLAARRFGAIAIATGTFLSLSRAIKSSLADAIEFERQFVNLSQVTGKSVKDLRDISQEITRLSTGLGVSSDQLLRTSVILAQAGLEARKTKAALEVLAKTELASSFDNIENTTEGAIAILSQFRKEAAAAGGDIAYLERALGAINDVSKRFAVESADLVAVIRRSGGAFEAAGGSLNELLALFTSVRATTRESAETIATGLRTIFTRIQRVDTIRQLQELGIALQDAEGKFVGPFEAIKRISEGLAGLDPRDFRFAAIVEELGGFRQIGKVIPLIKQFAVAQDALNVAQGASGSLAKDAEIAQQSLANQISKVKQEFQALIRDFVDSSGFQSVARGALKFASALIRIADALEPILPLIASLAALQIGKGLIPALGALTGVTRRNQGGKIHAFASGGFVPGVGNRDTVPAMMTPGEFVIRKSSAKKIGAAKLQALNSGGAVERGKESTDVNVGIFDSDKIAGGTNDKKAILDAIKMSKKSYSVIAGPAGSGKSTLAESRFGKNFVLSMADINKYSKFMILSGAGKTKSGDFSEDVQSLLAGAERVTVLNPSEERLMAQRQKRVDDAVAGKLMDQRSESGLKGTLKAPTSANLDLLSRYKNVEVLSEYYDGGPVKNLADKRPSLKQQYDISEQKRGIDDKHDIISIEKEKLELDYKKSRERAQEIFDAANKIRRDTKGSDEEKLKAANTYIKEQTGWLSQNLDKELTQKPPTTKSGKTNMQYLNKIAGAIAENKVKSKYDLKLKDHRIPDRFGPDFAKSETGFIEVKNKLETTSDKELAAKALSGYIYKTSSLKNGNEDTVPPLSIKLLTTNNEDILKKNAGGMIQKFAAGGIVDVIKGNQPVGILTTDDDSTAPYTVKPDYSESFRQQLAVAEPTTMKQGEQLPNVNVNQFGLNQAAESDIGKRLRQNLITNAANAVNVTAGQMSDVFKGLGIGINAKNLVPESEARKAITGSVVGTMFESLIRGVSNASGSDLKDSGYFDFVGPISDQATKLFEQSEKINISNYKDAKSGSIKKQNIASKVINQAAEEYGMEGVLKSTTGNARTADSILKELPAQMRADFLDPTKGLTQNKLKPYYKAKNEKDLIRLLEDKGLDVQTRPRESGGTFISVKLKDMKEMAMGGAASDTQPAMLTPGEFVVNKKKAQEIGYSTLHKMNKTGKIPGYAKGGVVGYANGGPVNPTMSGSTSSLNLQVLSDVFNRLASDGGGLVTSINLLNSAVQEMKDSGTKFTAQEKQQIRTLKSVYTARASAEKQQIESYKKLQRVQQNVIAGTQDFKDRLSRTFGSLQQFVFLGSAAASVVAQFSSLDSATSGAIAETVALGTSILGIVGTVGELILSLATADVAVKTFAVSVAASANASKTGGALSSLTSFLGLIKNPIAIAVAVIAAAAAAVAGYFYFLRAQATKLAESMNKAADDILQSAEQGKGGSVEEFVQKRLEAVAKLQEQYWSATEDVKNQEIISARAAATSLFNLSVASKNLEQGLANIEKMQNMSDLEKSRAAFSLLSKDIQGIRTELSNAFTAREAVVKRNAENQITDPARFAEVDAKIFDDAQKSLITGQEALSSALAQSGNVIQRQFENILKEIDFSQIKPDKNAFDVLNNGITGFSKNLEFNNNLIKASAKEQGERLILGARSFDELDTAIQTATKIYRDAEIAISNNEQVLRSMAEAARKQKESSDALNLAMEKQRGLFAQSNQAIQFFNLKILEVSQSTELLKQSLSRMSGEIIAPTNIEIQGIENLNDIIDPVLFKNQLDQAVAPLGQFGKEAATNLTDTANILDKAKKKLLNVRFGTINVGDVVKEIFAGTNISEELKTAIGGLIRQAAGAETEGQSTITPTEFENVIAPLLQQSEPFRKAVEGLINSQKELLSANAAYLTQITKLNQEQIDGQRKLVDIETRYAERLSQVKDKSLKSDEKEARRNARRGFGANNRLGLLADFKSTAQGLRSLQDQLNQTKDITKIAELQRSQARLSLSFNNLTDIVKELSDQSERASDVMSEIDKEQAKRDTLTKIVENFVVGGEKERVDIVKQFQGLQFAAATGSLQGLDEEQRKATFGLLEQLAAVDDRFKALKQNLVFSDALRMGLNPDVAMALATQTPKEEQLVNELRLIADEERMFQSALNENTKAENNKLIQAYGKIEQSISNFPNNLQAVLKNAARDAKAEQDKLIKAQEQAALDAEKKAQDLQTETNKAEAERMLAINKNTEAYTNTLQEIIKLNGTLSLFAADKVLGMSPKMPKQFIEMIDAARQGKDLKPFIDQKLLQNMSEKYGDSFVNNLLENLRKILISSENRINQSIQENNAKNYFTGGLIYASKGKLINMKPKGTDTVPAMLTPGEFVMRKAAVNKYGTGFMESINSGKYASSGGKIGKNGVSYFAEGGTVLDFATQRLASIADKLGVDPKNLVMNFEQMSEMLQKQHPAAQGAYTSAPDNLTPGLVKLKTDLNIPLDSLDQKTLSQLQSLLDHEISHAVDSYYGRLSGNKFASDISGSVFRDLGRKYDISKFLRPENLKDYITNPKDRTALFDLMKGKEGYQAALKNLTPEYIDSLFKNNPKLYREGFARYYAELPKTNQTNLLKSIKQATIPNQGAPTLDAVVEQYKNIKNQKIGSNIPKSVATPQVSPATVSPELQPPKKIPTIPEPIKPSVPIEAPAATKAPVTTVAPQPLGSQMSLQQALESAGLEKGKFSQIPSEKIKVLELQLKKGADLKQFASALNAEVGTVDPNDIKFKPLAETPLGTQKTNQIVQQIEDAKKLNKPSAPTTKAPSSAAPTTKAPSSTAPVSPKASGRGLLKGGAALFKGLSKILGPAATAFASEMETFDELGYELNKLEKQGKSPDDLSVFENTKIAGRAIARGTMQGIDPSGLAVLADFLQSKVTGQSLGAEATTQVASEASRAFQGVVEAAQGANYKSAYKPYSTEYKEGETPEQSSLNLLSTLQNEKSIIDAVKKIDISNISEPGRARQIINELNSIPGLQSSTYSVMVGNLEDYIKFSEQLTGPQGYDQYGNPKRYGPNSPGGFSDNFVTNAGSKVLGMTTRFDALKAEQEKSLKLFMQQFENTQTDRSQKVESQYKKESDIYDLNYKVDPRTGRPIKPEDEANGIKPITYQEFSTQRKERIDKAAKEQTAQNKEQMSKTATLLGKDPAAYEKEVEDHVQKQKTKAQTREDIYADFRKEKDKFIVKYADALLMQQILTKEEKKKYPGGLAQKEFEKIYGEGSFYDQDIYAKNAFATTPLPDPASALQPQMQAQVKQMEEEASKKNLESINKDIATPAPITSPTGPLIETSPSDKVISENTAQKLESKPEKIAAPAPTVTPVAPPVEAIPSDRSIIPPKASALPKTPDDVQAKTQEQTQAQIEAIAQFQAQARAQVQTEAPVSKQRRSIMQINAERNQKIQQRYKDQYKTFLKNQGIADPEEQMNQMLEQAQYQQQLMQAWSTIRNKYNNTKYWLDKTGGNQQTAMQLRDSWYKELQQFPQSPETLADPNFQNILYRATGGSIFKPKGTDTVPAMLTPGEFVVKKSSVDKYGINTMQAINNGTAPVMMNRGGVVYKQNGGSINNSPGSLDMGPLMQLNDTFKALAGVLNNMQMTHQVNVDGALNINGVNAPQVAEAIKTYLGEFIISEVKKIIDGQGKQFKQG